MSTTQDHLTITSGESGLRALLLRARGLDEQATVRFRQLGEQVDCPGEPPRGGGGLTGWRCGWGVGGAGGAG